jgi:Putative zinc-finger
MLSCRDIAEMTSDRIDGRLGIGRRLAFRLHVLVCRNCRRYTQQISRVVATLRYVPPDPMSPTAREDLMERFRKWSRTPTKDAGGDRTG